ncbi:MAG TPA: hypothetical protein VIG64_11480 [Actinomycetota bacterium]
MAELIDALRDAFAIHRCGRPERCGGCAFADLGTCRARDPELARRDLHAIAGAFAGEARVVVEGMAARMSALAAQDRFEEAAAVRDRGALLERALIATTTARSLVDAGDVVLRVDDRAVLIRDGQLAAATDASGDSAATVRRLLDAARSARVGRWLESSVARETRVIDAWLRRANGDVRILYASRGWAIHVGSAPSNRFKARTPSSSNVAGPDKQRD